jgi:hypothetical protein
MGSRILLQQQACLTGSSASVETTYRSCSAFVMADMSLLPQDQETLIKESAQWDLTP